MKLKIYNEENVKTSRPGERTIRINKKAGLISFSKTATEEYSLNDGDRIILAQDEENEKRWFFAKSTDKSSFKLRVHNGAASFNNSCIARAILSSLKLDRNAGFLLEKEPKQYEGHEIFEILTKTPLN